MIGLIIAVVIGILLIGIVLKILKIAIGYRRRRVVGMRHARRRTSYRGAEADQMTILAILVAVVLAFLAFKFVTGMIKFGVIAVIVFVVLCSSPKAGAF